MQVPKREVDGSVLLAGEAGNAWDIGRKGIFWQHMLWRRLSRKHRDSSSIAEVFVFESSLSCCSVLETCVMPVFLYESENWILTDDLVAKLEAVQAELVKRILKWSRHLLQQCSQCWRYQH